MDCAGYKPQAPCLKSKGKAASDASTGVPIDRGWAWVIVAASSVIFGLPVGGLRITGILYLEMMDHFDSDHKLTLWVFSTRSLVTLFSGPLASIVIQRSSHRLTAMTGTILVSGGIIATAYVPTLEIAFITYGFIFGFGAAQLHVSALTCTTPYFDKHRGLAVGLTAAGGGVLAFVLPHLARKLFDRFTFEDALLIYGGLFLHLLVCASLLRPAGQYVLKARRHLVLDCDPTDNPQMPVLTHVDQSNGHKLGTTQSESQRDSRDSLAATAAETPMARKPGPASVGLPSGDVVRRRQLFDWTLLKDERLWVMCAIMLFADNAFCVLYTAMPPYADSIGVTRHDMATFLAVGGAFELVCRALHGWLSDRKVMPPLIQLGLCSLVTGCAALLCPLLGSSLGLALLTAAAGAAGTAIFSLNVPTTRWLLGPDKLTSALGFQMFAQGMACVLSAFVAGYLTELTGSWRNVFYYIGLNLLAASSLALAYCLRLKLARQTTDVSPVVI